MRCLFHKKHTIQFYGISIQKQKASSNRQLGKYLDCYFGHFPRPISVSRSGDRIPVGGEVSRTCPYRPWGPPSLLCNGYRVFPRGKAAGRDADPSPPCSAVGHERVELYLYSPYGPYGLYRASVELYLYSPYGPYGLYRASVELYLYSPYGPYGLYRASVEL